MKDLKYIVVILFLFTAGLLTYRVTLSFFSDLGTSSGNVLSASAVFPSATPTLTPIATPTPQLADHVVISEVQIHGGNANQDFVELYNPTNSAVDLNGWQLRMKNSAGTDSSLVDIGTGHSIPARGFFLWSNNQGTYETDIGANVSNSNNIGENNSLELEDATNSTVDMVGWGNTSGHYVEGIPYPTGPGAGQSIERKAYSTSTATSMSTGGLDENNGNAFDAGDNSTDFVTRTSQPQNSSSTTETP